MKQITKEIKDCIHHYFGCDVLVKTEDATFKGSLHGIYWDRWTTDGMEMSLQVMTEHGARWTYKLDQVTLLVRKLSSMTEEEKEKLFDSVFPEGWTTQSINWAGKIDFINYYLNLEAVNNSGLFDQIIRSMDFKHHIKMVNWVRENKFDADELIDSGLALDKENK